MAAVAAAPGYDYDGGAPDEWDDSARPAGSDGGAQRSYRRQLAQSNDAQGDAYENGRDDHRKGTPGRRRPTDWALADVYDTGASDEAADATPTPTPFALGSLCGPGFAGIKTLSSWLPQLCLGLVAYAAGINWFEGGTPQLKAWFLAKFENQTSTSTSTPATGSPQPNPQGGPSPANQGTPPAAGAGTGGYGSANSGYNAGTRFGLPAASS
jgi:hypothetical protein